MLGDTVNARVVRILLECNLVIVPIAYTDTIHNLFTTPFCSFFTPPPADIPPGQTPPLGRHPPEQTTPWVDTPPGRHPPRADTHPGQTTSPGRHLPRSRHPLAKHAGRYGQRADGMYPTGMQSCYCTNCLYGHYSQSIHNTILFIFHPPPPQTFPRGKHPPWVDTPQSRQPPG